MKLSLAFVLEIVALLSVCCASEERIIKRSVGNLNAFGNDVCRKKAKNPCQSMQYSTCFGVKLPYTMTSSELVNENFTQFQIQNEMYKWEGLRSNPKCWAVIQPLLCAYYMPKCLDGFIDLPSQEMCRITKTPCRIIEQATKQWPEFLKCDDSAKFPPNCENTERRNLRFNTSRCMNPMIEVQNSSNYYDGFDGCALKCQDPLFSDEDHEYTSKLIKYFGISTLICIGLVIITFWIDWKSAKIYPSVTIFWANVGYFIATLGWIMQFLPNGKEDVICRKDGTIRRNEPSKDENVFCLMVFGLIYFGSMLALAWLVVFAYVWNLYCNAVGRMREQIDKKKPYFISFATLTPAVLTIICASTGKVDGNSMYGICFVGYHDVTSRVGLVWTPVLAGFLVILIYMCKGTYRLLSVSLSSSDFISPQGRAEIKSNAVRVIIFTVSSIILVCAGFVSEILNMVRQPIWESSLREAIICRMNLTSVRECEISEKPDTTYINISVFVFLAQGLLVSSWAWTSASVRTWKRFWKRLTQCKSEDSDNQHPTIAKHKLISKAFAKRHQLPVKGRLSLSLYSTHEDPVGLNKLLDPTHLCQNDEDQSRQFSQTNTDGQDISNEWAAALPHLVSRRGALVPPHSSNSVSCVSEDSRRPSLDSAMSEQGAVKHLQGSSSGGEYSRSRREWFRMNRRSRSVKRWRYPWRRGNSSSSLESNPGSQILPAITALIDKRQKLGDDQLAAVSNNYANQKPIILRELAIQTSFEKLYTTPKNIKPCNLSSNLTADKATQSSLVNLNEVGTQTKKSATKKKDKNKEKSHRGDKEDTDKTASNISETEDPVLKLLTPN